MMKQRKTRLHSRLWSRVGVSGRRVASSQLDQSRSMIELNLLLPSLVTAMLQTDMLSIWV